MSKNAPKPVKDEKGQPLADLTPAVEELQALVGALEDAAAAAIERADKLEARVEELSEALVALPELLASGASLPATAEKKPVDTFDYAANPEGRYALVPGKITNGMLDHPFEPIQFKEGKPQRANPAGDGWLRNQINAGFIVRWDEQVGEEHDKAIEEARAAADRQAKIDEQDAA